MTDVELREDTEDAGSVSGDFTAELCEVEIDYSSGFETSH